MQDAKEEIRSRLAIEDVIGEYVQLKRAGRNFKGLSPFTSEKTPSFVVSPDKNIWHDFSSSKGGDIFSFVMEVEGLDFRAALEQLARKAGVDLSEYETQKSGELVRRKKRLLEANELAARYYQQSLLKNRHALEYVFKIRGLSKEIVQEFQIGYAPSDGEALIRILTKRGFSKKELSDAGLANRYGGDLFRGRMTVPLMDATGQVVGFTGRILTDDPKAPKYLNTPATLIYDKSRHVFGLSQAKEAIRQADSSVIVEGNLDVVSSHQAGVKNVVASAGTAMTEYHLKALARLSPNVKLSFDADRAGLDATERAIPIAGRVGVELSIVSLPKGAKDPDELIQQDAAAWKRVTEQAEPVMDWVVRQYSEREDMNSATGKRRFTSAILAVIRLLEDAVEQEHYLKQVARLTDSSLDAIKQKMSEMGNSAQSKTLKSVKTTPSQLDQNEQEQAYQDDLLAALIVAPSSRTHLATFDPLRFTSERRQLLGAWLKKTVTLPDPVPEELQSIETYVKIVLLKAETRYEGWGEQEISLEIAKLLRRVEMEYKKQTKEQLIEELRRAEADGDDKRADELRGKLHNLIKETA
ncbi:DNA primase [Candidatus Saccharibacteria bacterium RAAC3_TM7_1]|nr:DNA primase [Candidatus Saccharibacteria bacterium RAAC3_TM7_1]HCZ28722.1 DNA primase [Candidatus Saccharibacteria bacterium]